MKRLLLGVLLSLSPFTIARADRVADGLEHFQGGRFSEAHDILSTVETTHPQYLEAKFFDLQALFESGHKHFRRQIELQKRNGVFDGFSPERRENLDFEYALSAYRQHAYTSANDSAQDFLTTYPQTTNKPQAREIILLSRFEMGRKNLWEAKSLKAPEQAELKAKEWNEAIDDLEWFLTERASLALITTGPLELVDAAGMQEKVWLARMFTGEEEALLEELPQLSSGEQERFRLLRAKARFDYLPTERPKNFEVLMEFIETHPQSEQLSQMKLLAAITAFREGAALAEQSDAAVQERDFDVASEAKDGSNHYLERYQSLCNGGLLNAHADLHRSDIEDLQEDLLKSHHLMREYQEQVTRAREFATLHPSGSRAWAVAKLYEGIGLAHLGSESDEAAAAALDAILEGNVEDKKVSEHIPTIAAHWRILLAAREGDFQKVRELARLIRDSMPDGPKRTETLSRLEHYLSD